MLVGAAFLDSVTGSSPAQVAGMSKMDWFRISLVTVHGKLYNSGALLMRRPSKNKYQGNCEWPKHNPNKIDQEPKLDITFSRNIEAEEITHYPDNCQNNSYIHMVNLHLSLCVWGQWLRQQGRSLTLLSPYLYHSSQA
jgi:hypothetical protein